MTDLSELLKNAKELKKTGLPDNKAMTLSEEREREHPFGTHAHPRTPAYTRALLENKASRMIENYDADTHTITQYGSFAQAPKNRRALAASKNYATLNKPVKPRIVINDEDSYVIPDYPRLGPRP